MEQMLMVRTAAVLLAITALGGLAMAAVRLGSEKQPPSWLAMLHGLLAGAALTLLIYAWFTAGLPAMAAVALLLFLVAAAVGVYINLGYHVKQVLIPKGTTILHALVAVVGFVLLLIAAFR